MNHTTIRGMFSLCLLGVCAAAGCSKPAPAPVAAADAGAKPVASAEADVVAHVNGVAISSHELTARLRSEPNAKADPQERRKAMLEAMVGQEAIRQRAVELGLESDPMYLERMKPFRAQLRVAERAELADAFLRREVVAKAEVSDADAKKYFDDNAARLKTELHVEAALMLGDESALRSAEAEVKGGAQFEVVARRQFPTVEEGQRPWDLGFLNWAQVPEPWREAAYKLKDGEVAGVMPAGRKRGWLVKVVARRDNPAITFDALRGTLVDTLRASRVDGLRANAESELRASAKVTYP